MLSVTFNFYYYAECHYAECRGAGTNALAYFSPLLLTKKKSFITFISASRSWSNSLPENRAKKKNKQSKPFFIYIINVQIRLSVGTLREGKSGMRDGG
jgi:hypothetical protein